MVKVFAYGAPPLGFGAALLMQYFAMRGGSRIQVTDAILMMVVTLLGWGVLGVLEHTCLIFHEIRALRMHFERPQALAEYSALMDKYGADSPEAEALLHRYSFDAAFVGLAATAKSVKLALVEPPLNDSTHQRIN